MFDRLNLNDVKWVVDLDDYIPHDMDKSYLGRDHVFQLTQIKRSGSSDEADGKNK